jgi:hypothetical protein
MRSGSPYLKALATPGAVRFSAAGVLGRMPISMFGLGTVLLIASLTGRYAPAGATLPAAASAAAASSRRNFSARFAAFSVTPLRDGRTALPGVRP